METEKDKQIAARKASLSAPAGSTLFNVNEPVWVKLTERGRKIHRAQNDAINEQFPNVNLEYRAPEEDAEGWSKWQMWSLMQTFGAHIGMGIEPPFETTIAITSNVESTREAGSTQSTNENQKT